MPTVKELRAELKAKGLDATGNKAELEARLSGAQLPASGAAPIVGSAFADVDPAPSDTAPPKRPRVEGATTAGGISGTVSAFAAVKEEIKEGSPKEQTTAAEMAGSFKDADETTGDSEKKIAGIKEEAMPEEGEMMPPSYYPAKGCGLLHPDPSTRFSR